MKSYFAIVSIFFLTITGCYEKYRNTSRVCNEKLFVQRYHNSVIDIGYEYLTDSCNFRIYVGRFDNEHGSCRYQCKKDSVIIFKNFDGTSVTRSAYSLEKLRNRHDFHLWNSKRSSSR